MKTYKLALISGAILATLLVGAFVVTNVEATRIQAKLKWQPNAYHTDMPVPQPWIGLIHFTTKVSASDIDPSTVFLEGLYQPTKIYDYAKSPGASWVVLEFNGYDVLAAALAKLGHMAPGQQAMVVLTITGALYDGRTWSTYGSGTIVIFDPEISPP